MKSRHDIRHAFRNEFSDWRVWRARSVVVAFAALAGLAVVGFTAVSEYAFDRFAGLYARWWWSPLLWTPLCTAAIVWLTRRYAPGAAGSGIPQVMAALEPVTAPAQQGLFVSLKLSAAKVLLTTWGLAAGLSLGREGPSVQVAAGVMLAARRWLPERGSISAHGLLVAGGAAGIAAAFNTPLGGIMFAIEELSRTPEQRRSGLLMAAIVLAGLIGVSINGNGTYFGLIRATGIDAGLIVPGLIVALASGLAGGLFSRLLLASLIGPPRDWFSRARLRAPVLFAAGCGLAVAAIGIYSGGAVFGSSSEHTRAMLAGAEHTPGIFFFLKFLATWLTAWAGVPAGIFAPSLAIGAALGNDLALLLNYPHASALMALGMVGFLAAATQAPLTSFIIVMEMVDGHAMVLSLMACAMVARTVSRVLSPPLYAQLAQTQLMRLPQAPLPKESGANKL
ncbi:chloride channel protein [Duganella sp. FT94W]|uniref:Chloride channel protein n=1 Tax=Duganella lactea TaxID=2692173 RepID=A0ABW9V8W3_9BURK|nr:chloride channel protein [Duganella lactea]MYM35182.1 chloride channel protein [Duganella lactea]